MLKEIFVFSIKVLSKIPEGISTHQINVSKIIRLRVNQSAWYVSPFDVIYVRYRPFGGHKYSSGNYLARSGMGNWEHKEESAAAPVKASTPTVATECPRCGPA
ncbi:hypothetical protein Trydic_g1002 [Trypoxylus dichotomus]